MTLPLRAGTPNPFVLSSSKHRPTRAQAEFIEAGALHGEVMTLPLLARTPNSFVLSSSKHRPTSAQAECIEAEALHGDHNGIRRQ